MERITDVSSRSQTVTATRLHATVSGCTLYCIWIALYTTICVLLMIFCQFYSGENCAQTQQISLHMTVAHLKELERLLICFLCLGKTVKQIWVHSLVQLPQSWFYFCGAVSTVRCCPRHVTCIYHNKELIQWLHDIIKARPEFFHRDISASSSALLCGTSCL